MDMKEKLSKILSNSGDTDAVLELTKVVLELATEIDNLKDKNVVLESYIDTLEEDLREVENVLSVGELADEGDFDEDDFTEINCSKCTETIYIDNEIYNTENSFNCPNCGENMKF